MNAIDAVGVPFSHAFQPIVHATQRRVFAYEALVRGSNGEPAASVFDRVNGAQLHAFDRASRFGALALAARLGMSCNLTLNVLPRGLDPLEIHGLKGRQLLDAHAFPLDRVILEVTESEIIEDHQAFATLINQYRAIGTRVAIDDFGAGYSGLNLLSEFQPDLIKLDIKLVRGIGRSGPKQSIVRAIVQVCEDLGIDAVAEGIEDEEDYWWCADIGIALFQGFLFARPGFECLPAPSLPG